MIKRRLTHANKDQIIEVINQLDYSHAYEIQIKRYSPKRTNQQNNLLWKWHSEVAVALSIKTGHHWRSEDVHYLVFCPKFMPGEVVDLPDNTRTFLPEGSSKQDISTMSEAMTRYQVWAINYDIDLTQPDEGL